MRGRAPGADVLGTTGGSHELHAKLLGAVPEGVVQNAEDEANFVTLDEDPVLQVMFIVVGSTAQSGETLITMDDFSVETRLWP